MRLVFWAALLLLVHSYVLYPALLVLLDALRQLRSNLGFVGAGRDRRQPAESSSLPRLSVVVAAHNEQEVIAAKLENSLSLDYPDDRLEVLIGSDGSTDDTDRLVSACPDPRVCLSRAPRAGKASVLNRCLPAARGDIVLLTDANTMLNRSAGRKIVRAFRDPEVGSVCGRLKLHNRQRGDGREGAYWTYETMLKLYEGGQGAVMGANGGIYAIRRSLFRSLDPETVVDDLVIPLRILAQGYRVVFDPEAVAYEETAEGWGIEFRRRVRIAAGDFQSLRYVGALLSPRMGFASFAFWSHKVLRWVGPLLMLALLGSSLWLAKRPLYRFAAGGQIAFYLLAYMGARGAARGPLGRIAALAHYFVAMNLALLAGLIRYLRGAQRPFWDRTPRTTGQGAR